MLEQDAEWTPVVFRAERTKGGEVTAVFPTLPADLDGRVMTCYGHVGQHGGCTSGWYNGTRAARPAEYADLRAELEGVPYGYRLKIYKRIQPAHRKAFDAEVRRLRNLPR